MDADDAPPAGDPARCSTRRCGAGWRSMLRNCTEARLSRATRRAWCALAEYSRDCLRDLRDETGITYDDRQRGTLQLFRTQKQLDHVADDTRVLDEYGVPYEVLDRAGCVARRAGARPTRGQVRRRPAPAGRRDRRRAPVHPAAGGARRRALGVDVPLRRRRSSGCSPTAAGSPASTPSGGTADAPTPMSSALGSYSRRPAAAARHRRAGLSGEGLFDHRADRRRGRRPGLDRDGRDLQGRDHPARRPHPRRRHGRAGRLQLRTCASRAARRWSIR